MIRLYPNVKVTGQSFRGVKRTVVPNQSMSLREILQRFVRRESLPIVHEGQYESRFGDLEKLNNEDITVKHERAQELKESISAFNKRQKAKADAIEAARLAALVVPTVTPSPSPTSPPVSGTS